MRIDEFLVLLDEIIEADPGTLTGTEVLKEVEGWDSLAVVQFLALVDEKFALELEPERIEDCKTVNDLIGLLGERIIPI